jgi:antitoxin (DNA-binding transcriptional repressor) of toxin-antitoxin stability system
MRHFRAVLDAAESGELRVVLRRGKPVAVITPFPAHAETSLPAQRQPGGLVAAVGLFADWDTFEDHVAEVIAARGKAHDRPPREVD